MNNKYFLNNSLIIFLSPIANIKSSGFSQKFTPARTPTTTTHPWCVTFFIRHSQGDNTYTKIKRL